MTVAARSSTTEQIHQWRVDSHAWTRVNEGCPGPPICCDPDQEGRVLSWAASVLGIFPCRVCSFQPPQPRLAKSLPLLTGALGVSRQVAMTRTAISQHVVPRPSRVTKC